MLGESRSRLPHRLTTMNKYRFHIPGLIHLPISEKYQSCAFTQKIVKLSRMLLSLGHEVYLYGAEGSDAPCTEFIQTHSLADIRKYLGDGTDNELGYDYFGKGLNEVEIHLKAKPYFNGQWLMSIASEIRKRKKDDDFLLLPVANPALDELVGLKLTVESGVGYSRSQAKFRAFESAFIMNFTYGAEFGKHVIRPSAYDRVIPNYFNESDFEYTEQKEDFFLFIGRLIEGKGIKIAVKIADALGKKLLIAGQGALEWNPETGYLRGRDFEVTSPNIELIGYADKDTRKFLMSKAQCVLVPSLYAEPFGGVNVEAQLSGTPVLTTPYGAFQETVRHGVTGYLCYTNEEFIENARKIGDLNPKDIRTHAERYLMDRVKYEYQNWFDLLYSAVFNKVSK